MMNDLLVYHMIRKVSAPTVAPPDYGARFHLQVERQVLSVCCNSLRRLCVSSRQAV